MRILDDLTNPPKPVPLEPKQVFKRKGMYRAFVPLNTDTVRGRPFDYIPKVHLENETLPIDHGQLQHHYGHDGKLLAATGRDALVQSLKKISGRIRRIEPLAIRGSSAASAIEACAKLDKLNELFNRQTAILAAHNKKKQNIDHREQLKFERKQREDANEIVRLDGSGHYRDSKPVAYPDYDALPWKLSPVEKTKKLVLPPEPPKKVHKQSLNSKSASNERIIWDTNNDQFVK